ncbi:YbgC/FadM family acyl-CoA thioesterase [Campylobacter suis]|uniref:Acyl-CoA thioesterase YbgC n=1 Tax=Campylobacter suis TaxID=2790657 RepID=A0ABN7K1W5_9BACT|nr:YbgC/FadM family acyl-CoA thioesterase [Campylobacter suis]CAD7286551.1 Acyl-CoA thioesterase YbgC [Campylobacter suis]
MKVRVYYEDTDAGGIVYHSNYIKFCERARSELLFKAGIKTFDNVGYFVVSEINAKFLKPSFLGDILHISTKTIECKNVSATLLQEIYRVENLDGKIENELVFSAKIKVAFMSGSKPVRMPSNVVEFFKVTQ